MYGGEHSVGFQQAGLGSNRTGGSPKGSRARGRSDGSGALALGSNEWLWPGFDEREDMDSVPPNQGTFER